MLTPKLKAVAPGSCGDHMLDHNWQPTCWTETNVLVPGEKDEPPQSMNVRNAGGFTCARCLCYVDAAELYDETPVHRDPVEAPDKLAPEVQPHIERLETLRQFLHERAILDNDTETLQAAESLEWMLRKAATIAQAPT